MLEFVRNMKIFGSEDLLWLLSYWSRDILPGNVRLFFEMSMVVIQTMITNFTLLCHVYVARFDHQMWHMTGFQLLWIVTGASCMWGQETHSFRNAWFHLLWGVHDFTYSLYILHRERRIVWFFILIDRSALFIIYRTSSIGMYLKFERNRTTTFGPIAFQRYYDSN